MKMGSIAIAVIAEYGEFWPSAISLIGSSCTNENPASAIHRPSSGRSPISPIPQLSRDGIENSGTSRPAWRPWKKSRAIESLLHQARAAREHIRLGQEADDDEGLVRKVEEVPGMDDHAVAFEQFEDQRVFGPRRRDPEDGRPAAGRRQHGCRARVRETLAQRRIIAA